MCICIFSQYVSSNHISLVVDLSCAETYTYTTFRQSTAGRLGWLLIVKLYDPQRWLLESPTAELLVAYSSEKGNSVHCKPQLNINGSYFIMDFISYVANTRRCPFLTNQVPQYTYLIYKRPPTMKIWRKTYYVPWKSELISNCF